MSESSLLELTEILSKYYNDERIVKIPMIDKKERSVEFFKAEDFKSALSPMASAHFLSAESAAEFANAILESRGVRVWASDRKGDGNPLSWDLKKGYDTIPNTHTALLINIQPIARPDTAESLLRELVDELNNSRGYDFELLNKIGKRAKKLLGEP